jgi:hypothetical protein
VYTVNSSGVITAIASCITTTTTTTTVAPTVVYVSGDIIGVNAEQIRFRSRTGSCAGAPQATGCQIDISYDWTDLFFGSGSGTATIGVGASQTIVTPSGDPLEGIIITSVTFNGGSCSGYSSSIIAC